MSRDFKLETETNRLWWNERVGAHVDAPSYNTASILDGKPNPMELERAELGDVAGKSLLHMQCHFGLDTLSWALRGADVTGLDFSSEAIETARDLASRAGLQARFLETNILEADQILNETFDVVFTSWGVLCWLPDHKRWAEVAAHFVKPGGTFYIAEIHPLSWMFDVDDPETAPRDKPVYHGAFDYFREGRPHLFDEDGSYAAPDTRFSHNETREWQYELGRIISNLIDAGLQIEFVHEHPFTCFQAWPCMVEKEPDRWYLPDDWPNMPLSFSIRATKPL